MQRLLVFASGPGGSGFRNLVERSRGAKPDLLAEIVGVVSNHEYGGVRQHAEELGIPFTYFRGPFNAEAYRRIVADHGADWVALSGWLKLVTGLDPRRTINIHPGPLPEFGGVGMYGHRVHEAVIEAYKEGRATHSAVTMHFVNEYYDRGPIFFRVNVRIFPDDTPESLQRRVNLHEHWWQPIMTNLVVNGKIFWDGVNPESVVVPKKYQKYSP